MACVYHGQRREVLVYVYTYVSDVSFSLQDICNGDLAGLFQTRYLLLKVQKIKLL